MDTCTVETGLLKKKPCGQASVTRCENCEQFLCSKHAIAQLKPNGLKSGKFMCKECDAARRDFEKNTPPTPVKVASAPAADAAKNPPAKQAPKPAPVEAKADDGGALEFTPSTDKK